MKQIGIALLLLATYMGATAQTFLEQSPAAQHWVDSIYKHLSKKEKIAQLMVVRLSEKTPDGYIFHDTKVESDIQRYSIGAICLFQGDPVRQANLINHYQSITKTPLLICIDGETGVGMRMYDSVVKFPDQLTIGAIQDPHLVYSIGKAIGEQCKRIGIQVDYAPVVDINNNPNNPVIGYRSFGEDKYKVAAWGIQLMKGMQDAGVLACAKHFPGHGDVAVDSHVDLPIINKSLGQLDSLELYPFKALFDAGVGSVLTAHLSIPSIDTSANRATSMSRKNVTGLLKDQLGFKGLIFTDGLEMKGVTKYFSAADINLQSLIAGNDMLCLAADIPGSLKKIKRALRKGDYNKTQFGNSVRKVLLAKYNLGLPSIKPIEIDQLTTDLNKDVRTLRAAVAANALTLLRLNNNSLLPLISGKKIAYVGIGISSANTLAKALQKYYNADTLFFDYKSDSAKANLLLNLLQNKYDEVIVGVHQYTKFPAKNFGISTAAVYLLQQLQINNHVLTMLFGNPYALKNVCDARNVVACYDDDVIFQNNALDFLQGKIFAKGKLPVTVCPDFTYGSGITPANPFLVDAPESVGMSSVALSKIDSIANDAIRKQATPGCVVLVARNGKLILNKAYGYLNYDSTDAVTPATVYDLASVTKISATTVSVMKLYEEGKLDITKTLGDYLPWVKGSDKANIPLDKVLLHQAGLNPFIPFYRETIDTTTGKPKSGFYQTDIDEKFNIRVADKMYMRKDWIDTMYSRIVHSKLTETDKYVYSDNDFILLGKVVEQLTGKPLDRYVREIFYEPLQMESTSFKPRQNEPLRLIAPTEKERYFRLQQLRGDVHDPGAAMFGGVAGHAGLFSNAIELSKLYQLLLNGGELNGVKLFKKETIDLFTDYHSNISRRGFGFDKPEKDNATSKDPYPSVYASPKTFGHTGFTGTCVWVDPKYNLIYIFLSNRVCPDGGDNGKLSQLSVRRNIMDVIYQSIESK